VGMMTPHDFSEEEKALLMSLGREIAMALA
jgi:hypothetical protein